MQRNQLTQILSLLIFSFIVMMAIRLSLYGFYPEDFKDLTSQEFFQSIFMGLRVDMITLFTFSAIFILILLFVQKKAIRVSVGMTWGIFLNTIFILDFSDVLYYYYIHRHMSNEVFNLGNDMDIIFGMAFGSMLHYTLVAILLSIAFLYGIYKLFKTGPYTFIQGKKLAITFLAVLLLLFIGIRNNFAGKSFGISDAYAVNKVSSGNLALNGVFTMYRSKVSTAKHNLMPLDEAVKITRNALSSTKTPFIYKDYPLERHYTKHDKPQYNVVIVLLESFGAEHLDGFTHYKELGITPYFKKISEEGLKFTNFYSNGYRSIFGITSVFSGVTIPLGFPYLGHGLELSNLSYLGKVAKDNGYHTIAMQAANRRSYRVDAVSHLAGFDQYYGAEDMPNIEQVDPGRAPETGTYDYNMLAFYHKKLDTMKEPFLGFAFTDTTHSDYHLPSKKFERYPHDLKNYNGSLNAHIYTDDAIRRFIEGAKKEPWFDRTIFIFTSDHGSGDALNPIARKYRPDDKPLPSIEHFRIPLIIYAPKIFKPQVIKTLGCHNDIFPTIVDMLGWKADITTMGSSLFDKNVKKRFAYFFAGDLIGIKTDEGYIKYNFKHILETSGDAKQTADMKKLLFAVDTAEAGLLKNNKWAK